MQIPSFGFESDEDVTTGFFFIACDFEFYSSLDYRYYFMLIHQGRGWCLHTRFIFNFVSIWINSWYLWKTLRYMPVINKPVKQFKQWLRSSYLLFYKFLFFVLLSPFHISRIILYIFFFLYSHVVASIFWVKIKAKRQWLITGIDPFSLIFYDCFLKTFYKLCFLRLIFIKLNEYRDIIIQRLVNLFIFGQQFHFS